MEHLEKDGPSTRSPGRTPRQARQLAVLLGLALLFGCAQSPPADPTSSAPARARVSAPPPPSPEPIPDIVSVPVPAADPATAKADLPVDQDPAPLRPFTDWEGNDDVERGAARDQGARARRTAVVEKLFADAGVTFPATQVLFRVFKKEHKLEVWANDAKGAPMKAIATYGICRISGDVGPKRHEGDRQVPEGFYEIPGMWTDTPYHLALDVNYPNPYDRAQTPNSPGSAILVHGSCVSIGCISMSDERIEELWTIAAPLYRHGETVKLHIFPSRNMKELLANPDEAEHVAFWKLIEPTLDKFNDDHVLATVTFDWKRDYVVNGTPLR